MNAIEFQKLMDHHSIRKYRPKVIVGGFGSWQLERKNVADKYGIDCVVIGGRPALIIDIFEKAVSGKSLPNLVRADDSCSNWDYKTIPKAEHASIHGAVEISKGCGRNCQFCTPTMQNRVDLPLDNILYEVDLTTREGSHHITLVTEDLFLYGAKSKSFIPKKEAVVKLVKAVASRPGVRTIQASHISLAPVVFSSEMISELAEILVERSFYSLGKKSIVTAETGIETGSTRLMKKYMSGKMLPYKPEQWQEIVVEAFGILNDNDWCPLTTLIVGLPEEKEEDVLETLELMDKLKHHKAFYVPLFFVPLENCVLMNRKGVELDSLSRARWDFFIRCWEYNVRIWKPTFLEGKIKNSLLYKAVNNFAIPIFGRFAGFYYGLTRCEQLKQAFWTLSIDQRKMHYQYSKNK